MRPVVVAMLLGAGFAALGVVVCAEVLFAQDLPFTHHGRRALITMVAATAALVSAVLIYALFDRLT